MGDPKGFIKYSRKEAGNRSVTERIRDYSEVEQTLNTEDRVTQAARCMDCGIPFCHWHCPLGNLIPEFQDAMYKGDWKEAYDILSSTDNFPEFTGRVCPALCEHSCVLALFKEPLTIRENELAVVERAFMDGYVKPKPPEKRTGKKVAVIGSGPAGMVAADDLNKAGHHVTLFEKDDGVGGLLRYGIPDFKLNKFVIDRRAKILEEEGLEIKTNTMIGNDISPDELLKSYDAVCVAIGSLFPRNLPTEGRDLKGIHYAMDYLEQQNKLIRGIQVPKDQLITAKGKDVLVIGGGDTGSDCVGTANRQGAKSVTQIEIMPQPPDDREEDNPWPYYAKVLKTSSSHLEGCERYWSLATKKFTGKDGKVQKVETAEIEWQVDEKGKMNMVEKGGKHVFNAELVLLALGFVHPVHGGLIEQLGVELNERGTVKINQEYQTSIPKVFATGDVSSGASLVVTAMANGKEAAKNINLFLEEQE
jgi:glutamate synthase (NADPH/NADH) small chain